jgi:hypothetical protein
MSRVGRHSKVDYNIAFADTQALQSLCKKMHKCRAILDTSLDIAAGHEAFWQGLTTALPFSKADMDASHLETYKAQLRNHRRSVQILLDSSVGVSKIVSCSKAKPLVPKHLQTL